MKLKSTDTVKTLYLLFSQGFIKQDDIDKLIDSRAVEMGQHLHWTLEQYSTITEIQNDYEIVKYILQLEKKKLSLWGRLWQPKDVLKMKVGQYFDILKFVKDGVNDINTALSEIEQPKMSSEMIAAGFGSLNFKDKGIARTIGQFENIGTIRAYDLQMHFIVDSLSQLAQIKTCEKNHQDLMEIKAKQRK
jgi:hypothetical protein